MSRFTSRDQRHACDNIHLIPGTANTVFSKIEQRIGEADPIV
ncbi:hypothetical protein [Solemya elarraichensis gill symbiont]|nr:hypothetical protein [Solemya elarraichensis gill symbiont]